jgi:hypothetical protein
LAKHYFDNNGITLFLSTHPSNYEPFSNYFSVSVGAVPKQQHAGADIALLGSTRALANQGGKWIRPPNGQTTTIFCACKTRKLPFFTYPTSVPWDGSLLGLYPTQLAIDTFATGEGMVGWLNNIDWEELGAYYGGRYKFSQRQLMNIVVPKL